MASSPYFRFKRRYEELSVDPKTPVLVEVEGVVARARSATNELTIEHPKAINVTKGGCDEVPPNSAFESGRAEERRAAQRER